MPTASMGSVSAGMMSSGSSSNSQRGINYSTTGFATSATAIRGGVTTRQTAASMRASAPNQAPRRAKQEGIDPSGNPEGLPDCGCYWYYDEGEGVWKCTVCDCEIDPYDGDYPDHCTCDPCRCPIEWDWSVLAFLSLLSFAYIAYKKRQKMSNFGKRSSNSFMRFKRLPNGSFSPKIIVSHICRESSSHAGSTCAGGHRTRCFLKSTE